MFQQNSIPGIKFSCIDAVTDVHQRQTGRSSPFRGVQPAVHGYASGLRLRHRSQRNFCFLIRRRKNFQIIFLDFRRRKFPVVDPDIVIRRGIIFVIRISAGIIEPDICPVRHFRKMTRSLELQWIEYRIDVRCFRKHSIHIKTHFRLIPDGIQFVPAVRFPVRIRHRDPDYADILIVHMNRKTQFTVDPFGDHQFETAGIGPGEKNFEFSFGRGPVFRGNPE